MDGIAEKPLGLEPKKDHDLRRMDAISDAMERYLDAGFPIPSEWVAEQIERIRRYM